MSLFESIKKAIFYNPMARGQTTPQGSASAPHAARPAAPAATTRSATATTGTPASQSKPPAQPATAGQERTATSPTTPSAPPPAAVDIEAVLDGLASRNTQKLNWRTSIVDLMKLVDLDSSIQHRKELAAELGYGGDTNDSAAMNTWLHKAVMRKLAENGGKVPSTLQ